VQDYFTMIAILVQHWLHWSKNFLQNYSCKWSEL